MRSDADFTLNTKGRVMDKITVQLAGRVAEQMVFGTGSTYGTDDLRVRTVWCCYTFSVMILHSVS